MFRHKHWHDVRATGNRFYKLFRDTCMAHLLAVTVEVLKSHVMIDSQKGKSMDVSIVIVIG